MVIDPLREVGPYIEKAEKDNASIKYVLETHFHADFVSGHTDLSKKTGAPIVYGPNAKTDFEAFVVFINFWASWCPLCRAEMPSLNELYKKLKDDNRIVFLFLNEDDDQMKARQYLDKNNFDIPLFGRAGNIPTEIST